MQIECEFSCWLPVDYSAMANQSWYIATIAEVGSCNKLHIWGAQERHYDCGGVMKSLFALFGAIALFLIAGGVWMYLAVERADLRYRLTYEVEADGVVRTGSSVRSVYFENTEKLPLPNTGGSAQETGEAVVIDLGGGRYLFSLMTGGSDLMLEAFADRRVPGESVIEFARKLAREKPAATLPFSKAPRLVTFTDITNAKTVKLADPANLAATFGAGVKLKRITVEITDDAVTEGEVEKVLGWLIELNGKYLHGGFTSRDAPLGLQGGDFKMGYPR
jgi:hypothetical protein